MATTQSVHARIRLDFDTGASLGPGKVALLEQIEHCGSLSQAARVLGLSYRRAWLLLDDINQSFREAAVVTATGGRRGGGARVTKFGLDLIKRYRKLEQGVERQARREFARVVASASPARAGLKRRLVRATRA
jgi:molybdate transport system regulatory protein